MTTNTRPRASDDAELMERAAREALTQPSDSAMWDERLYDTHGLVINWADLGDDVLAESNYHAMLSALQGVIAHADGDPDDIIDASVSHWAVGSLRQIFVRVYDSTGAYTEAFREAVDLAEGLKDYPILDGSDFSEREHAAWEVDLSDAFDRVTRDHEEDSDAERLLWWHLITDPDGPSLMDTVGYPEVAEGWLKREVDRVRDEHFAWLGCQRDLVPGHPRLF